MEEVHWFEKEVWIDLVDREQRFTYLMLACGAENYPSALRLLLEGADVNARSKLARQPCFKRRGTLIKTVRPRRRSSVFFWKAEQTSTPRIRPTARRP